MQDFIPAGTGNSRYMKSSIPSSITFNELIELFRNGTFPFDLNGINPSGIAQQGTALNKENLLKDATAALYGLGSDAVPSDVFQILSQAALYKTVTQTAQLGTLPEGSIIYLNENGTPVPFYVAKQDYEPDYNTDRVLVVRQEELTQGAWNSSGTSVYDGSTIDTWMTETYLQMLDPNVQTEIGNTNIPYISNRNANVTRIEKSVFALSLTECGGSDPYGTPTGTILPISSILSKPSADFWTRTPAGSGNAWRIVRNGSTSDIDVNDTNTSYRPAFTLPTTFTAYTDVPTSGLYDVLDNLLMKLPGVQIATGSYIGTGTYGADNPNSLTFDFDPRIIAIGYLNSGGRNGSIVVISDEINTSVVSNSSATNQLGDSITMKKNVNGISWWSTSNAVDQGNMSGKEYFYLAIG